MMWVVAWVEGLQQRQEEAADEFAAECRAFELTKSGIKFVTCYPIDMGDLA